MRERYRGHVTLDDITGLLGRASLPSRAALNVAREAERITVSAVTDWAARLSALTHAELASPPALAPPAAAREAGAKALTAREREVVTLVARGYTDAQIAAELFISVHTVGSHLDRIRDKTGCRRRAELTRLALQPTV